MSKLEIRDLTILQTLLEERHVSKTADRLGLTQSAVSKALSRLRIDFEDALLIRSTGGYQLTHNAIALKPQIQDILDRVQRLEQYAQAAPGSMEAEMRVGMADDLACMFLPKIQKALKEQAPHVKMTLLTPSSMELEELRNGQLDVAIEIMPSKLSGLYSTPLFTWQFAVLMNENHPLAKQDLTLDKFAKATHGLVSFTGDRFGIVDEALTQQGLARDISLVLPNFATIPYILLETDLLFTIPMPLAQAWHERFGLVVKPVPLQLRSLEFSLIWQHRNQYDKIHGWFRKFLRNVLVEEG